MGAWIERLLEQGSRVPIEVLNFSTMLWSTRDEIGYLVAEGNRFDLDLVLVVYVLNDAQYAGDLDLWEDFRERYEGRRFPSSYLASYLSGVLARRALARDYIESLVHESRSNDALWQDSFAALSRGKQVVESTGGRFGVVLFPFLYELDEDYPFRSLHEMVAAYCAANDIELLDLFPFFEGRDHEELWVHPSDQHPNARSHEIAGRAVADFVRQRGLLVRRGPAPPAAAADLR